MIEIRPGLNRAWKSSEMSAIGMLVSIPGIDRETARSQVEQAVVVAQAQVEPWHVALSTVLTTKGPAIWIDKCFLDDIGPVLNALAESLSSVGVAEAVLAPMPMARVPLATSHDARYIKTYFVLSGHLQSIEPTARNNLRSSRWVMAADVQASAVTDLAEWVLDTGWAKGRIAIATNWVYLPVAHADVADLARRAAAIQEPGELISIAAWSGREFRVVSISAALGLAAAVIGSTGTSTEFMSTGDPSEFDWQPALAESARLLEMAGPWCVAGNLSRGLGAFNFTSRSANHADRYVYGDWTKDPLAIRMAASDGFLFDAFGVMRMSPEKAAVLPSVDWTQQQLPDGTVLVRHRDVDGWFANDHPDRALHLAARRQVASYLKHGYDQNERLLPGKQLARES